MVIWALRIVTVAAGNIGCQMTLHTAPSSPLLSSSSSARDAAKEKELISLVRRVNPVSADAQAERTELQWAA